MKIVKKVFFKGVRLMKKLILSAALITLCGFSVFAGDVATFVDKGFTEDGRYYFFGQYGKIDEKYQAYAEIYQVDIASNDFVDSGVFKTKPSSVTNGKKGIEVYESLEMNNFSYLKNFSLEKANLDQTLYILDDVKKSGTDEIVFKDFAGSQVENPDTYHIQLVPTINGYGKNVRSSFYIDVEKRDANGNRISYKKVGSPNIVRKGVSNYKIERIFCDKTGRNFIFVVEKIIEDDLGISVRYMVEAAKF